MIVRPRVREHVKFPSQLVTTTGQILAMDDIFNQYDTLIVVTMKYAFCPVCPNLLKILNFMLGLRQGADLAIFPRRWEDPVGTGYAVKLASMSDLTAYRHTFSSVFFLVLCPGSQQLVRNLEGTLHFPYPFVADPEMSLTDLLGLKMPPTGCWPAVLEVKRNGSVEAVQIGRGPGYYGDIDLVHHLHRRRIAVDIKALTLLEQLQKFNDNFQTQLLAINISQTPSVKVQYPVQELPSTSALSLPNELILQVCNYLDTRDLRCLALLSNRMRRLALTTLLKTVKFHVNALENIIVAHTTMSRTSLLKRLKSNNMWPSVGELRSSGIGVQDTTAMCSRAEQLLKSLVI